MLTKYPWIPNFIDAMLLKLLQVFFFSSRGFDAHDSILIKILWFLTAKEVHWGKFVKECAVDKSLYFARIVTMMQNDHIFYLIAILWSLYSRDRIKNVLQIHYMLSHLELTKNIVRYHITRWHSPGFFNWFVIIPRSEIILVY